jgi:hypothetical protein
MNTDQNKGTTQFLNFSDALNHLRWGERIARREWKGEMYLWLDYSPERHHILLYIEGRVPITWSGNAGILAEDWYVLGEHQW